MTTTDIDTMTDEDWEELRKNTIFVRVKKTSTTVSANLEWGVHVPAINGAFMEKVILPPLELGNDYNRALESHIQQCRTYVKQHAIGEGIESKRKDGIPLVFLDALIKTFAEYKSFYMMTTEEYEIFKNKADVRIAEYNHALNEFMIEYPDLVEEHKQLVLQGMERQMLTTFEALYDEVSKKSFTNEEDVKAFEEEMASNFSLNADDTLLATYTIEIPKGTKKKHKTSRLMLKESNKQSKSRMEIDRERRRNDQFTTIYEVFFFTGRKDLKDDFIELSLVEREASQYPTSEYVRSKHTFVIPIKELPSMDLVKAKLNLMQTQKDEKLETTIEKEKELGVKTEVEEVLSVDDFKTSFGQNLAMQREQLLEVLEVVLKSYFGTKIFNRVLLWGDDKRSAKIAEYEAKQLKLLNSIHDILNLLEATELFKTFNKKELTLSKTEETTLNTIATAFAKIKTIARNVSISTLDDKIDTVNVYIGEIQDAFQTNHSPKKFPNIPLEDYKEFNKGLSVAKLKMDKTKDNFAASRTDSVMMSRATLNGLIGKNNSDEQGLLGRIDTVGTKHSKQYSDRLKPFIKEFENILDVEGPNREKSFIDPINGFLDVYRDLTEFQKSKKAEASWSKQKKSKGLL